MKQQERYNKWKKLKGTPVHINRLKNVALIDCGVFSIEPLAGTSIVELNLSHNSVKDLIPLQGIKNLYYLTLRYNGIEDVSPLGCLKGVYMMNLRHNKISNIEALENLRDTKLSRLYIGHNPISDFSPLRRVELIEHDIDKFDKRSGGKYKKQSSKVVAERKDIIGRWSDGSLYLTGGPGEAMIAFEENGTGFLHYIYDDYSVVDTFNWVFDNGCISVKGIKRYTFAKDIFIYTNDDSANFTEDKLMQVSDSLILDSTNVEVWTYETEALNGSFIQALRFSEPLDVNYDFEYGQIGRDIWKGDFYSKLKDIIRKY